MAISKTTKATGTIPSEEKKTKRNRYQKKIVFPEFLECSKYTLNNYWIQMMTQCSYGKFPRGLSYQDGKLLFKKKNIVRQFSLPDSPEQLCRTLIRIFREELCMVSSVEDKKQTELVEKDKETVPREGFLSEIKDKNVRFRLLFDFTVNYQRHFHLTEPQRQQLYAILCIGQLLKIIQPENIEIQNHRIIHIDHIHFRNGRFELDLDQARLSSSRSRSKTKKATNASRYSNSSYSGT